MKKIFLLIAGFTFQIEFDKFDWIKNQPNFQLYILHYFKPFVIKHIDQKPHMIISFKNFTKTKSIIKKFNRTHYIELFEKKQNGKVQTNFGISLFHFQLILRNCLEELLLKHNGFLLHASANYINKKTFVFIGPSGAGKTTISGLLNKQFQSLADDSIIIRKIGKFYKVFQTPFQEKVSWITKNNAEYPLGKICILKKSQENKLTPLHNKNIMLNYILKQLWFTEKGIKLCVPQILDFLSVFNDFYYLKFKKDGNEIVKFMKKYS